MTPPSREGSASCERPCNGDQCSVRSADAQTCVHLQAELLSICAMQRTAVLFVTHSIDEAVFLADHILVFTPRSGRLAADVAVDLSQPRVPGTPAFAAIAGGLRAALGSESSAE